MELVIFFESKTDKENKGYFKNMKKIGFSSVHNVNNARKFRGFKQVIPILEKLNELEGKYYSFSIWEVLRWAILKVFL